MTITQGRSFFHWLIGGTTAAWYGASDGDLPGDALPGVPGNPPEVKDTTVGAEGASGTLLPFPCVLKGLRWGVRFRLHTVKRLSLSVGDAGLEPTNLLRVMQALYQLS